MSGAGWSKRHGCGHRAEPDAQARAKAEGLNARFMEGGAEALPFEDASFDVVTSLVGAMFAPRLELVAREPPRHLNGRSFSGRLEVL